MPEELPTPPPEDLSLQPRLEPEELADVRSGQQILDELKARKSGESAGDSSSEQGKPVVEQQRRPEDQEILDDVRLGLDLLQMVKSRRKNT